MPIFTSRITIVILFGKIFQLDLYLLCKFLAEIFIGAVSEIDIPVSIKVSFVAHFHIRSASNGLEPPDSEIFEYVNNLFVQVPALGWFEYTLRGRGH